jgi:hypothetical protein
MKALLIAFLVAVPAFAAEEPEAVYAKFHKAGLEANFDEMRKWGSAAGAAEIAAMPAAQRQEALKFLAGMLPKTYRIDRKSVDASRAILRVSSKQPQGIVYGVVNLIKEGGEWKVEEEKWGEPAPR